MASDSIIDPNLPPDVAVEQQSLVRRRRLAEAMLQRGMTPVQSSNPRAPVSWTQGLAQIANAYYGAQGMKDADQGAADLSQNYQKGLASEVQRIASMRQGAPASTENIVDEQAAGGEGAPAQINAPAVQADPRAAVMAAMSSQYPTVRKMGEIDYSHMKKADEPYTLGPDQVRFGADGNPISLGGPKSAPEKSFKVGDTRKVIDKNEDVVQEYQADGSWKEIGRGSRFSPHASTTVVSPPAVTTTQVIDPKDPNRLLNVDARTYKGGSLGSPGVIGVSGKVGDERKLTMKREFNMQGIGATIQKAEDLLTGKNGRPLPTGSGVGSAVDAVGGFFGMSPDGSIEAQQLKAVGGALTAKMPRMEGPQSDKDTALYREMAAMIGDASVPVQRRRNALDTVKELWAKYENLNADAFANPPAKGGPGLPSADAIDAELARRRAAKK